MVRRINKSGGVTLPKTVRVEAGLHPGAAVDISAHDGRIVLTPVYPCCSLCGTTEDVHDVAGVRICRSCAEKIKEAF